jgi:CubicO group peptidase (beta-lactamase class C family)
MKSAKYLSIIFLFVHIMACSAGAVESPIIESRVDALFAEWDKPDSPGCALGIYRDGQLVYARGYGMANLELGIRIKPQSVFDIGSTSKQFTAFSIMLLAKDNKLSLDDDIRKFVPEIPDYGKAVTIRHLLHHTSGIRDYCELLAFSGFREEDLTTNNDALQILSRQKALNFQPGEEYLYSNSGYFLLSLIIKRVSGQSLRDFAQERIFGPLGMRHTQYNDSHTRIIPGRATGYAPGDGGFVISMSDWEQTGDGAVLTSVEDLLLWDWNFYDAKAGGADVISQMLIPGRFNDGRLQDYAAGLGIGEYRGLKTVSHGGAWAGYRAELLRFPELKFSVACLCNLGSMNPSSLAMKVAELYLADQMQPEIPAQAASSKPAICVPAAELVKKTGVYRNPKTGAIWQLTVEAGKLLADAAGLKFQIVPTVSGTFRTEGFPIAISITFPPSTTSGRPRLRIIAAGEKEARFLEPIDLWTPAPEQLAKMAGNFRSDELGTVFALTTNDGKLLLSHRSIGEKPVPLKPTLKDSFTVEGATITFISSADGKIDGFNLDSGRMKKIRFIKQAVN